MLRKTHNSTDIGTIVPPALYILEPRRPVRLTYSQVVKVLTAAGCAYEIVALPDRSPLPTISELVSHPYRHRFGWAVWGWFVAGWLVHFRPRRSVAQIVANQ